MSKVKIQGNASGTGVITLTAPNTSTDRTVTLPDADVTLGVDATKLPLAGGTMTGHLLLNDSVNIKMGAGADFKLSHDGNNSYIEDAGTGSLRILSSQTEFKNTADSTIFTRIDSDGIKFGSDTAAANALDDYEEGTWTPTISGTNSCSMSTIHQSDYTKVGNVVKLYTSFNVASSATPATGTLIFGGFPFSFKTSGETAFLISLHYNYKDTPMAFVNQNGNIYYQNGTTGGNNLGNLTEAFDAVTVVGMNFTYLTS